MTDLASITIPVGHELDVSIPTHATAGYGINIPKTDDVAEVSYVASPVSNSDRDSLISLPVGSSLPQRLRIVGRGKGTAIITESRPWEDKEAIPVLKIIVE